MLDFKELAKDGQDFELLLRELLFNEGLRVYWSGKGPDGGKDLICIEDNDGIFSPSSKTWLIQCKHKAHSESSVGVGDLDDIVDSCSQHDANGYLLATSTQPSSAVVARLEGISNNPKNNITATYWDSVKIEQLLSTPNHWRIAQRFFPISANEMGWQIYATEKPNHWVVNFKGYYFHLSNRIGSRNRYHLETIENRILEIEKLDFPEKHFIRMRAVHFDDKNGNYTWYLDYMHPHNHQPIYNVYTLKRMLGNESVMEDGQFHFFDINIQQYLEHSDHYDPDHYDYYDKQISAFITGREREKNWKKWHSDFDVKRDFENESDAIINDSFSKLHDVFSSIPGIKIIRSENSTIEHLDRFCFLRNWQDLIEEIGFNNDRFFSAWFLFRINDEAEFINIIEKIPISIDANFRLAKAYIVTPSGYDQEDSNLFEITFSIHPSIVINKYVGRELLNNYFNDISVALDGVIKEIK